jgi:sensor histidine kinase regulating citrate/malate metabolism
MLIQNTEKHGNAPEGGQLSAHIQFQVEGENLIITYSDNGGGVELEEGEDLNYRIFEKPSSGEASGGVGMKIVQEIIKRIFQGTIAVENTDKGLSYTFSVPLNASKKA